MRHRDVLEIKLATAVERSDGYLAATIVAED
jgi:hypothetical protein